MTEIFVDGLHRTGAGLAGYSRLLLERQAAVDALAKSISRMETQAELAAAVQKCAGRLETQAGQMHQLQTALEAISREVLRTETAAEAQVAACPLPCSAARANPFYTAVDPHELSGLGIQIEESR